MITTMVWVEVPEGMSIKSIFMTSMEEGFIPSMYACMGLIIAREGCIHEVFFNGSLNDEEGTISKD